MQQYKDRDPKWIKLDGLLLDDYEFTRLDDAAKYHVIGLRLLAAKLANKIPNDAEWLKNKLSATELPNIQLLINAGFIEPYDGKETCVQIRTKAYLEESRGDKSKEETEESRELRTAFRDYWNSKDNLIKMRVSTKKRADKLNSRFKEEAFNENWQEIIDKADASPFLCGKNDRQWKVDAGWIVANSDNYVKVLEGRYDSEKVESPEERYKREEKEMIERRERLSKTNS